MVFSCCFVLFCCVFFFLNSQRVPETAYKRKVCIAYVPSNHCQHNNIAHCCCKCALICISKMAWSTSCIQHYRTVLPFVSVVLLLFFLHFWFFLFLSILPHSTCAKAIPSRGAGCAGINTCLYDNICIVTSTSSTPGAPNAARVCSL